MLHRVIFKMNICALDVSLKIKVRQARMIIRTPTQRPMEFAIRVFDGHVIDAGMSMRHQTICIEFPVLVAV